MEKRGKSVESAIEEALKELNASIEEVDIEIIEEGAKGFLGIGAKEAVVRVTPKSGEASPVKAEPKAAPEAAEDKGAEAAHEAARTSVQDGSFDPAAAAESFLKDIFEAMRLDVDMTAELNGDTVAITLSGENMGIVIGKRGDTLDSLQYLTSLVVNRHSDGYIKITIDTENYRAKREEALLALSDRIAAKVEKTGKKFTLEPMNPYERRIIHANLQDNPAVTTYSIGQEPFRKVVIASKNPKPFRKNGGRRKPKRAYGDKNARGGYRNRTADHKPQKKAVQDELAPEKKGSYTTTYKADFKPQQHKAQYASFEEYLAAQEEAKKGGSTE